MAFMFLAACGQGDDPSGDNTPAVNPNAPTLGAIGNKVVAQGGSTLVITLSATDPNQSALTFSWDPTVGPGANPESQGAVFTPGNATFSWNYGASPIGQYSAKFIVTNNQGLSDSETISIRINDGSPVLNPIGNKTASLGSTTAINFTVSATDPNGLSLSYAMDGSVGAGADPATLGATFASRVFNWDISNASLVTAGTYNVKFTVTNSNGQFDSETISITIQDASSAQYANGQSKYNTYCKSCHGEGGVGGTATLIQCIDSVTYYTAVNGGVMNGQASALSTQDKADVLYYLDNYAPGKC